MQCKQGYLLPRRMTPVIITNRPTLNKRSTRFLVAENIILEYMIQRGITNRRVSITSPMLACAQNRFDWLLLELHWAPGLCGSHRSLYL